MIIDTHCHLDLLDNPLQKINHAQKVGVNKIIVPFININSAPKIYSLSQTNPNIYYSLGIYPTEVQKLTNEEFIQNISQIENLLSSKQKNVVAIGECGLDFNEARTDRDKQINLFTLHLEWAEKYRLPLIIHNRKANQELFELVVKYSKLSGVFHCFAQGKKFAKTVLSQTSFYFGLGGLITTDLGLMETVKDIPLERIVLETDAPYLTPKPAKKLSNANEPQFLVYTAQKLAEIKGVGFDHVCKITSENAIKLFNIS